MSTIEAYKELGVYERHFNALQGTYRGIASTWLLATFSGIGYIFQKGSDLAPRGISVWLATAAIALAGGTGIFLLWILDVLLYHRLLVAVTRAAAILERELGLPELRNMMAKDVVSNVLGCPRSGRGKISWFYALPTILLLIASVVFLASYSLSSDDPLIPRVFLSGFAGHLAVVILVAWMLLLVGFIFAILQGNRKVKDPIAIWLIPAKEERRRFQNIITRLAEQHSTPERRIPVFPPHVTLCTGRLVSTKRKRKKLSAQVDKFCSCNKKVVLKVCGQRIDHRWNWPQFLYLAFDAECAPPVALNLAEAQKAFSEILDLRLSTDSDDERVPMPHLSLMYCEGPINNICETVEKSYDWPASVLFDAIQVVTPNSGDWTSILNGPDPFNRWEVLDTKYLID